MVPGSVSSALPVVTFSPSQRSRGGAPGQRGLDVDVVIVGPAEPPAESPGAAGCLHLDLRSEAGAGEGRESPGEVPLGEGCPENSLEERGDLGEDSCVGWAVPPPSCIFSQGFEQPLPRTAASGADRVPLAGAQEMPLELSDVAPSCTLRLQESLPLR